MYTKINKTQARKLWNGNKNFIIVPCKCGPASMLAWTMGPASFEHMVGYEFDRMVNAFEYYNCNNETGKYAAFYIY